MNAEPGEDKVFYYKFPKKKKISFLCRKYRKQYLIKEIKTKNIIIWNHIIIDTTSLTRHVLLNFAVHACG